MSSQHTWLDTAAGSSDAKESRHQADTSGAGAHGGRSPLNNNGTDDRGRFGHRQIISDTLLQALSPQSYTHRDSDSTADDRWSYGNSGVADGCDVGDEDDDNEYGVGDGGTRLLSQNNGWNNKRSKTLTSHDSATTVEFNRKKDIYKEEDEDDDEGFQYDDFGFGGDEFLQSERTKQLDRVRKFIFAVVIVFLMIVVFLLVKILGSPSYQQNYDPTVILVSLDGFRSEYLSRGLSPSLQSLAKRGIQAEFMRPSFPSITFPNHYTIITGLYPESHGIVGNVFYDPSLNDTFVYVNSTKNNESKWWGGEPLWVTTVKQGQKSATCMWPGSEAAIKDTRPTYWLKYNASMSLEERVDKLLNWLLLPKKERPTFLTLYAPDVDSAGHSYGPNSKQVNSAIVKVDNMIQRLMNGIEKNGLWGAVNLIVVSDHGMTDGVSKWIYLEDYIDIQKIHFIDNVVASLYPNSVEDIPKIYANLKNASLASGVWNVWLKEQVPEYLHYSHNDRIGPIVLLPDSGWGIALSREPPPFRVTGMHGYNNTDIDMQAIFIAAGPAFVSSDVSFNTTSKHETFDIGTSTQSSPPTAHAAIGGAVGHDGHLNISMRSELFSRSFFSSHGKRRDAKASSVHDVGDNSIVGQLVPAFNNVNVYNLVSHILGLTPASNNGTQMQQQPLSPFLKNI